MALGVYADSQINSLTAEPRGLSAASHPWLERTTDDFSMNRPSTAVTTSASIDMKTEKLAHSCFAFQIDTEGKQFVSRWHFVQKNTGALNNYSADCIIRTGKEMCLFCASWKPPQQDRPRRLCLQRLCHLFDALLC